MTAVPRRRTGRALELDLAWWDFHEANPWVLNRIVELLDETLEAGLSYQPIDELIYAIRRTGRLTKRTDEFKINQNHGSRYARYIAYHYPEYSELFRLKRSDADGFNPRRRPRDNRAA